MMTIKNSSDDPRIMENIEQVLKPCFIILEMPQFFLRNQHFPMIFNKILRYPHWKVQITTEVNRSQQSEDKTDLQSFVQKQVRYNLKKFLIKLQFCIIYCKYKFFITCGSCEVCSGFLNLQMRKKQRDFKIQENVYVNQSFFSRSFEYYEYLENLAYFDQYESKIMLMGLVVNILIIFCNNRRQMIVGEKKQDDGMQGPIFYTKVEEKFPIYASYSKIKDPRRLSKRIQIHIRVGRTGQYTKSIPHFPQSSYFDQKSGRQTYTRRRKNSSDDDYNVKNQKKDRNVTSNLIHHLMKYLTTIENLQETVQLLITKRNLPITFDDFQLSLNFQSKNLKTYVTVKHIKQLWFSENPQKRYFCILMRILSKNFLCKHCFLSIYFSNKFNRNSKLTHYKGLRSLLEVLSKRNFDTLKMYSLDLK